MLRQMALNVTSACINVTVIMITSFVLRRRGCVGASTSCCGVMSFRTHRAHRTRGITARGCWYDKTSASLASSGGRGGCCGVIIASSRRGERREMLVAAHRGGASCMNDIASASLFCIGIVFAATRHRARYAYRRRSLPRAASHAPSRSARARARQCRQASSSSCLCATATNVSSRRCIVSARAAA